MEKLNEIQDKSKPNITMAMDNYEYAREKTSGKIVLVKQTYENGGRLWRDKNECFYDKDHLDFNVDPNDARLELQYANEERSYWRKLRRDITIEFIKQCNGIINYNAIERAVEHIMRALHEQDTEFWSVDTEKS